jgi:hypothetical protein
MQNKAQRRNVVPSTALTAGTTTSQVEQNTWGKGIRFYVTLSAVTTTGGTDKLFLCAQVPGVTTIIPLAGFSGASLLSTVGVYAFDFYPGAYQPATIAAGGNSLGVMGMYLPMNWAVQLVLGSGSAATVQVDAEILP